MKEEEKNGRARRSNQDARPLFQIAKFQSAVKLYPLREPFSRRSPDAPRLIFLGERWRGAEFGLARAEEGSGAESARASAFFFEKIGGYKKILHIDLFEILV